MIPVHPQSLIEKIFYDLREAGFPLGTEEYRDCLLALRSGYGLGSIGDVVRICKRIFLGHELDEAEFDYHVGLSLIQYRLELTNSHSQVKESPQDAALTDADPNLGDSEASKPNPTDVSHDQKDALQRKQGEDNDQGKELQQEPTPTASSGQEFPRSLYSALGSASLQSSNELLSEDWDFFLTKKDYLPLRRRELFRKWRELRATTKTRSSQDIDIKATTEQIFRQGFFTEPVFDQVYKNAREVILFIDHRGSMEAFESLGQRMAETAEKTGYLKVVRTLFFYNQLDDLYEDKAHRKRIEFDDLVNEHVLRHTVFLFFSDAGAAKGMSNPYRIANSRLFLRYKVAPLQLGHVWLNPMPRYRWEGNSAEKISAYIPMFEANKQGMEKAIHHLKRPIG